MHQRERGEQKSDAKVFQVLIGNLSSFKEERERDGKGRGGCCQREK
jgi:hypothetical protein